MKRGVQVYKGLNTDLSRDSIREGLYIDALDIRITTDVGESQACITNIKGNKWYFRLPVTDKHAEMVVVGLPEIIGVTSIRDTIVFFVADDSNTNGWIYKLDYSSTDQSLDAGNPVVVYKHHQLNFSKDHPIEAIGRFESGNLRRVYWTDYENYFRSINIDDPNLVYGSSSYPIPGNIDIFPSVEYTLPRFTLINTGGALTMGAYQYSYRLSTSDGKETLISPPGNLIHVTSDQESNYDTRAYMGGWAGQNSGKAISITINITEYKGKFDTIELICAINSTSTNTEGANAALTATPQIFSIEKLGIVDDATTTEVTFVHTGTENTITELTLDEYTAKVYPFKTPKTVAQKDGSLVVANIKGAAYSVQELLGPGESFDARTARYDAASPSTPFPTNSGIPDTDDANKDKNAFNVSYNAAGSPSGYNVDAHWDKNWHTNAQYKFKSDGETLGGQGPNISYTFHLEPFLIDNESSPHFTKMKHDNNVLIDLNDGYGNYANNTWDNMASPFRSGLIRGYKRGETYRFGIIFYDKKGTASFVEYIGDIKFPDISEEDKAGTTNSSGTNYFPLSKEKSSSWTSSTDFNGNSGFRNGDFANGFINTDAYALGIKFTLDFTSCPTLLDKVESYQIVRVQRRVLDSRRICSGIIKPSIKITPGTYQNGMIYDLHGPGSSDDIVHLFSHHEARSDTNQPHKDTGGSVTAEYGRSGTFVTLNNQSINGPSSDQWPVQGGFIHFASPDVSYTFPGIVESINQSSNVLITGRYSGFYSSINSPTQGGGMDFQTNDYADMTNTNLKSYDVVDSFNSTNGEKLGALVEDHRWKLRTVGRVDKDTAADNVEYIKAFRSTNHVQYTKNSNQSDDATLAQNLNKEINTIYSGRTEALANVNYYFRNMFCTGPNTNVELNDHETGGNKITIFWFQGASGILGSIDRITTDPITGTALNTNAADDFPYFRTGTTSSVGKVKPKISSASSEYPMTNDMATEMMTSIPIVDIMNPISEAYGGYTKTALENNVFMPVSPVISTDNLSPIVFGGDIFLNMWTFQEGTTYHSRNFYAPDAANGNPGWDQEFTENRSHTMVFVTESRVNIDLAWGSTTKTVAEFDVEGGVAGEEKEVWRQETDNTFTAFGKSKKMYIDSYEFTYSSEQDDLAFFVKPDTFDSSTNVNDIRAYISQVKINDEPVDSWTKYGLNDYRDVDDYGPINRILNWRDTVYFYQDTAVGTYSINPRAITSTDDGIPTELGSAKGLQNHQYITKNYGATHQWGVKATDSGIYSFDSNHKKIFKVTQGNNPLSEIKGIHSLLKNMSGNFLLRKEEGGDNPIKRKGVHIAKDKINNEVIFTFLGDAKYLSLEPNTLYSYGDRVLYAGQAYMVTNTYTSFAVPVMPATAAEMAALFAEFQVNSTPEATLTSASALVYDEIANEFSTKFSATPNIYLENGNILLSPDPNSDPNLGQEFYQHNVGNWGEFYGDKKEMAICLVLNADADLNKVLRVIEFNSIVRNNQKQDVTVPGTPPILATGTANYNVERDKTISAFRIKNEYQDTKKIQYSSGRIKRRFDKWRVKVPRDNRTINRMRSTYFELTLYFDNTENRQIIIDRILYYYDIQIF